MCGLLAKWSFFDLKVEQMVVAVMMECDVKLSDDLLKAIIDNASPYLIL